MPANLTPQYKAAEALYKQAQSVSDKILALEEMHRVIPKHKGTEKLCADIKQRLSKARKQLEQSGRSQKKGLSFHVPAEGAAQIVLVGPPNSGKSSLVAGFTKAVTVVADYPYSTQKAVPGMLQWENVQFQLVDLPPISAEFYEPWIPGLIRVSDMVLLVISMDAIDQLDTLISILTEYKLSLVRSFEEASYQGRDVKIPAVIAATKTDIPDGKANLDLLSEVYCDLDVIPVSGHNPGDAVLLGRCIFETLHFVRVYTKAPGKEANMNQPVVVRKGSTLLDVTSEIHKDFAEDMKYARVWGSGKYDGQKIQRDYVVEEGDVFEFKV